MCVCVCLFAALLITINVLSSEKPRVLRSLTKKNYMEDNKFYTFICIESLLSSNFFGCCLCLFSSLFGLHSGIMRKYSQQHQPNTIRYYVFTMKISSRFLLNFLALQFFFFYFHFDVVNDLSLAFVFRRSFNQFVSLAVAVQLFFLCHSSFRYLCFYNVFDSFASS